MSDRTVALATPWILAETVTEILSEVDELEVDVCYALGELTVLGGEPGLCIIAKTTRGSVAFIEDRAGDVWLQRCNQNGDAVAMLCQISERNDADQIAEICLRTLVGTDSIGVMRCLLH